MRNEELGMKNGRGKKGVFFLFVFFCLPFILFGCKNIFEPQGGSGAGLVRICIGQNSDEQRSLSRTVQPARGAIEGYQLTFSGSGTGAHAPVDITEGNSADVLLADGEWIITATAYQLGGTIGNVSDAVAAGSITVSLSGGLVSGTVPPVILTPSGSGNGTIHYSITVGAGVSGFLKLYAIDGITPLASFANAGELAVANSVDGECTIAAGRYIADVRLENAEGKAASRREVVEIWAGTTTVFAFEPSVFYDPAMILPAVDFGDFNVASIDLQNINYANNTLTITGDGTYAISMRLGITETTTDCIRVAQGVQADIVISDIKIDVSSTGEEDIPGLSAFDITGAAVNLTLAGDNIFSSGFLRAGLEAPDGSAIVITAAGTGSLTAAGGDQGAGIGGGGYGSAGGAIVISGGTIIATGGAGGAGIGGGNYGASGAITISGGTVNVTGGIYSYGIGSRLDDASGTLSITGGAITADSCWYDEKGIGGITTTITGNAVLFVPLNQPAFSAGANPGPAIIFTGANGIMYGNVTMQQNVTFPAECVLAVANGHSLTIPIGVTLTNNGTINCYGIVNGTENIIGNQPVMHEALVGMVWIPAGTFTMGSPGTEPGHQSNETQHEVTLTAGFYMGKYQVTQAQYKAVMEDANPSWFSGDNRPVETVSWYDAVVFCNTLSVQEGFTPAYSISGSTDPAAWGTIPSYDEDPLRAIWDTVTIVPESTGYRLPTEAQWEYACRAGTATAFNWGSDYIDDTKARYDASHVDANNLEAGACIYGTADVGGYAPNAWGLYDMHGNVMEWCWDWYEGYSSSAVEDPMGASAGSARVFRGGYWSVYGQNLRSAYRDYYYPIYRIHSIGFRLLRPYQTGTSLPGTVSVSGTVMAGETLTANANGLNGSGAVSYQWYSNGNTISEATGSAYSIGFADAGKTISVMATRSGDTGRVSYVTASAVPCPQVSISGIPETGETLTAHISNIGGTVSYQWRRGGASIGTNSSTYTVRPADSGSPITVIVTCSGITGNAASAPVTIRVTLTGLIEMVWIPAGTFTMGSPGTEPGRNSGETQHEVTLTAGFYMGKYQVTQAQYKAVMEDANPSGFQGNNRPVETVSWYDAVVFCNTLSVQEDLTPAYSISGSTDPAVWGAIPAAWDDPLREIWDTVTIVPESTGYRLPTEAQWEYACRAGTATAFNWGSDYIDDTKARYDASYVDANNLEAGAYLSGTADVGSYAPNAWGLYDMHGNVWEWCWDWLESYSSSAVEDPMGASAGSNRVFRGGGWSNYGQYLRSAYRVYDYPHGRSYGIGFRLLRP